MLAKNNAGVLYIQGKQEQRGELEELAAQLRHTTEEEQERRECGACGKPEPETPKARPG